MQDPLNPRLHHLHAVGFWEYLEPVQEPSTPPDLPKLLLASAVAPPPAPAPLLGSITSSTAAACLPDILPLCWHPQLPRTHTLWCLRVCSGIRAGRDAKGRLGRLALPPSQDPAQSLGPRGVQQWLLSGRTVVTPTTSLKTPAAPAAPLNLDLSYGHHRPCPPGADS